MKSRDFFDSVLTYCPHTGEFRWKVSRPPRAKAGAVAGHDNGVGYIKISVNGRAYYAHRIAFLLMTGEVPLEIDHINHCRSDNRWANLRAADRVSNCSNVAGRSGVRNRHGKWYARFGSKHLGVFETESAATAARREAEIRFAGLDPNRQSKPDPLVRTKRTHKSLLFEGKTLSEWSRITGIPQTTLHWRVHKIGMPPEVAIADRRTTDGAEVDSAR